MFITDLKQTYNYNEYALICLKKVEFIHLDIYISMTHFLLNFKRKRKE